MKRLACLFLVIFPTTLTSCGAFEVDPNQIQGFAFKDALTMPSGSKIMDELYATFEVTYPDRVETVVYNANELNEETSADFSFALYKEDDTTNVIDETLISKQKYTLEATYKDAKATTEFVVDEKVTLLKHENLKITYSDVEKEAAPARGEVKMLVIPVELEGDWLDGWLSSYQGRLNDLYFGNDPLSLSNYYKDASAGAMNISGLVSEAYAYTAHTSNEIQGDYGYLVEMMNEALEYVETHHPEINWSEYDLNNDNAIDNIHFLTNFNPNTYYNETGTNPWATNLWPHKSTLYNPGGTADKPVARVYSCGVLSHLIGEYADSAITQIHEQGHIFGLPDYYDYGGLVDYIGEYDMQTGNVLDWNSYSKLSVGWIDSYVVKDECTVTIGPASNGGKCLIIPAKYSSFNNSAFDEYFLIELFSNYGNNKKFPYIMSDLFGSNKENAFGVRLYHVDARLFNSSLKETNNPEEGFQLIDNNCYDYTYDAYGGDTRFNKIYDKKLLCLIQKGGKDTFGDEEGGRHTLSKADLFYPGDQFTFEKYAKFLSKKGKKVATMDNGEEFPYQIDFLAMNKDYATIKISKIASSEEKSS